ncbi:uncharacterized protein F5Z01DRAFT_633147 [Emericellopsis atlantica]|uniref:Uncharacterized protein n=1 Tax=Emericellopsis atlantica TaxID=2614577 RepID=A0A9P8CSS9_9HYPO|nr:uncharacterized protein F5Z01DRAFT_633147 [Emericellopsis atlantica]KAG9258148.1 hypothetical protein F5Z01DRAFT_633147 [Emericellopsis atlantica]
MKGPSIENLVYLRLFPKAGPADPLSFQEFVTRHLQPEVREESEAFYGHLLTDEAKHPGLDYTSHSHRRRLQRFKWHRRLFRAFNALSLTPGEILRLATWEGTLWSKRLFETEHGIVIEDTTNMSLPTWDDELERAVWLPGHGPDVGSVPDDDDMDDEDEDEDLHTPPVGTSPPAEVEELLAAVEEAEYAEEESSSTAHEGDHGDGGDDDLDDDDDEEALLSIGEDLNARLREAVARREAGDNVTTMDEDWERWLKMFIDSGLLNDNMSDNEFSQFIETTITPAGLFSREIMEAGRQNRWDQVPVYLHRLLRRALRLERTGYWEFWPRGLHAIQPRRSWSQLLPQRADGPAPTA